MARKKKSSAASSSGGASNKFSFKSGDFDPGITFTTKPTIAVMTRELNRFAGDLRSFRQPLAASVQTVLAPSIQRNFDVGGRPPWEPLDENTLKHKKRSGKKILVDTGRLRDVASSSDIWTVTSNSASPTLPSSVKYGNVHQFGSRDPSTDIPPRPFMAIQPEDELAVEEIFFAWIQARAALAGFKPSGRLFGFSRFLRG